ncbi:MAG: ABC transporter permease [Mycoplasmoidaceae bacterium]
MSFVYFKFLFINTIKRKPVWITWILFLFTCTCFIIILPAAAKMNTLQVWANTTMAICQTFMGMVASLFTAVLAINVFKDTNEEGTELIIISKPISRFKVVSTKFLLFGFFCLLINLTTVLLSVFTIFLPRTEPQFYFGLLVSMFIGNAITFAIFGSISILLTVKFAKVGVIVTNVIISLVFLIYQTLTLFVFSTPAIILDNNAMSASSYILHQRNTETGDYTEGQVVKFEPSEVSEDKKHPCQATNWREMKAFWENTILSKDVTPILNATDLAGQLALTYLSYKTNEYAQRQANRMFALSRFYNYQLTAPASPELDDASVPTRPEFNWIYTGYLPIQISEDPELYLYIPSSFGFEGIQPLTGTRLRGYTDQIPIGTVRSKEILSARDIYFEKEDWNKYEVLFQHMYTDVFHPDNYRPPTGEDPANKPIRFVDNLRHYYEIVWTIFVGSKTQKEEILENEGAYEFWQNYDRTSFGIVDIDDLNDRFIQFKNYCYYEALKEQQTAINDLDSATPQEQNFYQQYSPLYEDLLTWLQCELVSNSWMIKSNGSEDGYLEPDASAPSFDLIELAHGSLRDNDPDYSGYAQDLVYAKVRKTMAIFENVCYARETYLFDSLTNPTRSTKYSGHTFMVKDNWYPNLHGTLGSLIGINLPVGQNMQYFFYKTTPTLNYWMFAIIWGTISIGLFSAGIVVYNKYDVK